MAARDGIVTLLEEADLGQFVDSFVNLGATKITHFVDVDDEMMTSIGLTVLQIKRLRRIFHEHCQGQVAGASQSDNGKTTKNQMQSVLTFQEGKMRIEVDNKNSDKKKEWEKYIYPFPKTERMVYYNKVVEDICMSCHRLKPQTYIREQQSFRWDTQVKLQKLNKAVKFYHNDASGIPKYRKAAEPKKCDRKVCTSLLTKVEKSITEAEALDALLTQRRERLLDESASEIRKGNEEEVNNLNGFKGELQTILAQLQEIENDLRHSQLWLSRSRLAPTTVEENARIKRRKKENEKKIRKQAKCRLMNRCEEIINNLLGADTANKILSCIESDKEIPIKICEEKEMQVSHLYSLKRKFHLKALSFLRDKAIFCGEALGHIECTLHRLKTTADTDLESEDEQGEESEETNQV